MGPRAQGIWTAIAGLLVGIGLGVLLADGRPAAPAEPLPAADPRDGLRDALAEARRERDALAAELALLRAGLELADSESTPDAELRDAEVDADVEVDPAEETDSGPAASVEAWLLSTGFSAAEIQRLRERWDALELDRLYLIDQAKREDWHGTKRFRERMRALRDELREELGDDDYDAILYAAGRKNRLIVADVLENSPAGSAGIEDGDVILSYGGRRLFDFKDILQVTGEGDPGRSTEIRIQRGGEELRLFVPRGPLGVRIRHERQVPDTLR